MNPNSTNISLMSTPDLANAVIGLFLPPPIAVIQQPRWPKWFRSLVTAAICIGIALLRCWQLHELDPRDVLRTILIVLVTTLSTYEGFWQKTIAPAIEKGTSAVSTAVSTLPAFLAALPAAMDAAKQQAATAKQAATDVEPDTNPYRVATGPSVAPASPNASATTVVPAPTDSSTPAPPAAPTAPGTLPNGPTP